MEKIHRQTDHQTSTDSTETRSKISAEGPPLFRVVIASEDVAHVIFFDTPPRFSPGNCYVTPGASKAVPATEIAVGLTRHLQTDWGAVHDGLNEANVEALTWKGRLHSQYLSSGGTVFWVITDPGHHTTTVLLPKEIWTSLERSRS